MSPETQPVSLGTFRQISFVQREIGITFRPPQGVSCVGTDGHLVFHVHVL